MKRYFSYIALISLFVFLFPWKSILEILPKITVCVWPDPPSRTSFQLRSSSDGHHFYIPFSKMRNSNFQVYSPLSNSYTILKFRQGKNDQDSCLTEGLKLFFANNFSHYRNSRSHLWRLRIWIFFMYWTEVDCLLERPDLNVDWNALHCALENALGLSHFPTHSFGVISVPKRSSDVSDTRVTSVSSFTKIWALWISTTSPCLSTSK